MKQVPIKLGPLALLLTVISICVTTLAILTFTTARADLRLAEKYAQTVETRYALERQGQEFLHELSETDPADYGLMDWERDAAGIYWTDFEQDGASRGSDSDRTGRRDTRYSPGGRKRAGSKMTASEIFGTEDLCHDHAGNLTEGDRTGCCGYLSCGRASGYLQVWRKH